MWGAEWWEKSEKERKICRECSLDVVLETHVNATAIAIACTCITYSVQCTRPIAELTISKEKLCEIAWVKACARALQTRFTPSIDWWLISSFGGSDSNCFRYRLFNMLILFSTKKPAKNLCAIPSSQPVLLKKASVCDFSHFRRSIGSCGALLISKCAR